MKYRIIELEFINLNKQNYLNYIDNVNLYNYTNSRGENVQFYLRDVLHYWGWGDIKLMKSILYGCTELFENPSKENLYKQYFYKSCLYYSQKYIVKNNDHYSHGYEKIPDEVINYLIKVAINFNIFKYRIKNTSEINFIDKCFRLFTC